MKRLCLAFLAALLVLAIPVNVAAAPPQTFTATVFAAVINPGSQEFPGPRIRTLGEAVAGPIVFSTWGDLAGGSFFSPHNSNIVVDPLTGNVSGTMHGTFTMATADGLGAMEGTFNGKISGNWFMGIVDEGHWTVTKGIGTLKGAHANGTWSGILTWQVVSFPDPIGPQLTLAGPLTFNGSHH